MSAQACPICRGVGTVPVGFYNPDSRGMTWTGGNDRDTCRSCGGRGIVMIPAAPSQVVPIVSPVVHPPKKWYDDERKIT